MVPHSDQDNKERYCDKVAVFIPIRESLTTVTMERENLNCETYSPQYFNMRNESSVIFSLT